MIKRPSVDEYFSIMAMHASSRGSCARRKVGCVLIDCWGHTVSTGYNGPDSGATNCTDIACPGAGCPSGTGLEKCEAIHAEANALLQCKDMHTITTAYVTTTPCIDCTKLLLNTSCTRIVFVEDYATSHNVAVERWLARGRTITKIRDLISADSPVYLFAQMYGFKL